MGVWELEREGGRKGKSEWVGCVESEREGGRKGKSEWVGVWSQRGREGGRKE